MILKASQRGGARALAKHLLNDRENDHVEVSDIRGFISDELDGALLEIEAAAKGTKCRQYMFSVSLSPPESENVRPEVFELAAEKIEEQLGLSGQPRALVFHEKHGRRHAHCVWSRIDPQNMRAINLSFYKRKLNELSRSLFLDHGWNLPDGFKRGQERSPITFTLAEWQQAKRTGKKAADIKATFQECWNKAKDRAGFQQALENHGYFLAKGDRRGFVALDFDGEVYSITRMTEARTKAVKERLGDPGDLASVTETKQRMAWIYEQALKRHVDTLREQTKQRLQPVQARQSALRTQHRHERRALRDSQRERWDQESIERQARFSKGLLGVWDWLRGRHKAVRKKNEMEITFKRDRDRTEFQQLIQSQLEARQALQQELEKIREQHSQSLEQLYTDLARTQQMARAQDGREQTFAPKRSRQRNEERPRHRGSDAGRSRSRERTLEP
ncbi:relaxase/mobilization nuclease domain-containing protein [Chromatocurvus halotolerans]|uniref:MobA/VirD2-like nuclease domain-containing protein n=1 Tax=Chromatocurvus halotolerans TaxID=1132028 RepID=A0A4R2KF90_9GAMM|nr:relaxase/mobilization nuclease domain-containing protein [Chromatocurvus halotolerans]TCO70992.1 hypothetical protein EV688_1245 [Chromatocurvus halotolerans]